MGDPLQATNEPAIPCDMGEAQVMMPGTSVILDEALRSLIIHHSLGQQRGCLAASLGQAVGSLLETEQTQEDRHPWPPELTV